MRPHGSPSQLEERRRKAVALKEQGHGLTGIARLLDTTPQSVGRWLSAHEEGGVNALAARPTPGRPPRLTARQRESLVGCLLKGASAFGFATDLWTCPRIAQLVEKRWKVRYHVDHIPRLMAGLGFSPSKARGPGHGTGRGGYSPLERA
jgi:transposase